MQEVFCNDFYLDGELNSGTGNGVGLRSCPVDQYFEFTGNTNENNAYFESEEVQIFVSEIKN